MNNAMKLARNRSQTSLMFTDPCSAFCQLQIELENFYEINAFRERCNNQKCNASAVLPLSCEGDLEGGQWRWLCSGFDFCCCFVGFFESERKHVLISVLQRGLEKSLGAAVAALQPCQPKFCIQSYSLQKCKFSRASTCNRRTGIKSNRKCRHWLSWFYSVLL